MALSLVLLFATASAAPRVSFKPAEDHLDIRIDGESFARYVWEDDRVPRPYFAQLIAPGGEQVTRNFPPDPVADKGNDDHGTFHPGVWLAFGDINGADFWRLKARVRHVRFLEAPAGGEGRGAFAVVNHYERADGELICQERCRYTIQVRDWGVLLTNDSVFSSPGGAFAFGDQEEMGLGIRMATDLTVRHGGGAIQNREGGQNEKGTWGRAARWCAAYGKRDGVTIGAIVMPDPANFRASWFHSRDYGLIVANPFGKKAMTGPGDPAVGPDSTVVAEGGMLRFGCGIGFYRSTGTPDLSGMYADYLESRSGK